MNNKSWEKGSISITYEEPRVTPHRERLLEDMKDVMYFYYNIKVLDEKKVLFESSTHDFPKVQNLPIYIDHILNMKEDEMFVYEDIKDGGFERKKLYNFITLDDSFNMGIEYFYKIEKLITYVKQSNENKPKRYEEYTLTIGQNAPNKKGYSNGEDFGKSVFITYLKKEDLLRLKNTAQDFCKYAIEDYNKYLKKYKIKCPKCNEHQLFLDSLLNEIEDDCYVDKFKCIKCGHEFDDNDDYFID